MSFYFAQIDKNNIVINVVKADSIEWCENNLTGTCEETKIDGSIRKNYAGIGYTYDEDRDAFIPPKPFDSWLLDEDTCNWNPPVPYPNDDKMYTWNEETISWVEIESS
jgi:hypothetical protein